jgi:uncharacterized protein YecE (DUF72 family)
MIHLGTSGWYYDHWAGRFYPDEMDRGDWLRYYAERFDSVEVNASFYRMPSKNMVVGWRDKTPDDFVLTFKGSRVVTHRKKLRDVDGYLAKFYDRLDHAGDRRGPILWQLPPWMERDDALLESFLSQLRDDVPQAVEFRHESWFARGVYDLLEKYGVALCIVSTPDLPAALETTSSFVYIRWHGSKAWYSSKYSRHELQRWADVIRNLDAQNVYGYFNNDYNAYAPQNCRQLQRLLR